MKFKVTQISKRDAYYIDKDAVLSATFEGEGDGKWGGGWGSWDCTIVECDNKGKWDKGEHAYFYNVRVKEVE